MRSEQRYFKILFAPTRAISLAIYKDLAVRVFGGCTLMVLAS